MTEEEATKHAREWLEEGSIDGDKMDHYMVWGALRKLHHEAIAAAYEDAAKIAEHDCKYQFPLDDGTVVSGRGMSEVDWVQKSIAAHIRARAKEGK